MRVYLFKLYDHIGLINDKLTVIDINHYKVELRLKNLNKKSNNQLAYSPISYLMVNSISYRYVLFVSDSL